MGESVDDDRPALDEQVVDDGVADTQGRKSVADDLFGRERAARSGDGELQDVAVVAVE